jgi:hypothetical protein
MADRTDLYKMQAAYCDSMAAKASRNGHHREHWLDMRNMWLGMAECVSVLEGSRERQLQDAN